MLSESWIQPPKSRFSNVPLVTHITLSSSLFTAVNSNLPDKQASENGGTSCGVQSISLEDDGRLAEWKGILKEMADAFRAADENCADFVICPTEKAIAERKRAMALLDKYFDDLWN